MVKRGPKDRPVGDGRPEVGKAIIYPEYALVNAMLKNAVVDFKHADDLRSFSSLCFWLTEDDAGAWLKLLDLYSEDYFYRLIEGCQNGRRKVS